MKKFLTKITLITITSLLSIMMIYTLIIMSSQDVITGSGGAIFYVADKAEYNSGCSAVILGDSVCDQLWPHRENSPEMAHLSCNHGITAAGTYLLLKKYLDHNPQTQDVFYAIRPQSLGTDLGQYSYQFFVIPFVNSETIKMLDDETRQRIYEKFGRPFVDNKYLKGFLLNNNFFMTKYLERIMTSQDDAKYVHRLSHIAIIYLSKIHTLCSEHNIKLHVLPLPVPDTRENHDWADLEQEIKDNGLEDILGGFVSRIHYCPKDWYRDGVHFRIEILKQHLDEIRGWVMN